MTLHQHMQGLYAICDRHPDGGLMRDMVALALQSFAAEASSRLEKLGDYRGAITVIDLSDQIRNLDTAAVRMAS